MANKSKKANVEEPEAATTNDTTQQETDTTASDTANTAAEAAEDVAQATEAAAPEPEVSLEDQLRTQMAEINDKYLRLYSDFENFRKRTSKEKLELMKSGGADVMKNLLPVMDDFERAMASNESSEDLNAIKEGVKLVHHKFNMTLTQQGVKEIDAMGKDFDLDVHEAVTKIPAPDDSMKGKVVDVLEKGYYLNDKVIRYAKVVIGE